MKILIQDHKQIKKATDLDAPTTGIIAKGQVIQAEEDGDWYKIQGGYITKKLTEVMPEPKVVKTRKDKAGE